MEQNDQDCFIWAAEAGFTRLDAEGQANVGFRLLDLAEHSIEQCGIPQRRGSLKHYIKKLEAMLAKAEILSAEIARERAVAKTTPAEAPERERKMSARQS
jgi:hypothetical protein